MPPRQLTGTIWSLGRAIVAGAGQAWGLLPCLQPPMVSLWTPLAPRKRALRRSKANPLGRLLSAHMGTTTAGATACTAPAAAPVCMAPASAEEPASLGAPIQV